MAILWRNLTDFQNSFNVGKRSKIIVNKTHIGLIFPTTPKVCCCTTCGMFKFATNYKRRVLWNEILLHRSADNAVLMYTTVARNYQKCPHFACTHARRRLRHSSIIASSMTLVQSMPCQTSSKRFFSSSMLCMQLRLMHSLLDVTPYLVINRIKVGAIRRPQIWRNESGCWLLKKSHHIACLVCRCAVLLKDEEIAWHIALPGQQLLRQEHIAMKRSKSKPEVEFQCGGSLYLETGSSNISTVD